MRTRTLAFRVIAACLAIAMLAFAVVLFCWGVAGERPWSRVIPTLVGQCIFGTAFGMFALGLPGPFNRSHRR